MQINVSARFDEKVYCRIQGMKTDRNKYGHESDVNFSLSKAITLAKRIDL